MNDLPDTRESLILRLQSSEDRIAWEEFVEIYRPVVYSIAVSRGLQHADALDLVQTVFLSITKSISTWQKRDDGTRFRNWLLRIAKNATINALTRRPPDQAIGGDEARNELSDQTQWPAASESELDLEYRRQLYLRAAEQVRATVSHENWMAFELTAVQGMAIGVAANELGKSVGVIYAARSRIMKQLAYRVSQFESAYE